ncbi:MAG: response regulator [Thermoleophilia bacterium]|nr:response regulator [Thermoleophilia bacterium]
MNESPAWILVVDDDPVNRALLTRLLEQDGYRVDTAPDGRRALEMLEGDPFDVVLLDLLMPELDGYEVLTRMKADDTLRHVPVLMITALDDVQSAARCIEAGADDYLPKPFDPVVLRARVKAGWSKKRLHDLEARHLGEMARLNRRLEARIEEQMAELLRTGELKRFLPQQIADGLLAGELEPDKGVERKRITVLVADLVGFTTLSETLEPEELAQVVNDYLREMMATAVAEGGTLIDFAGDGVLVVYGAPGDTDEEQQALQAIRTGLGMRDRVRALAARFRSRGVPAELEVRVGVNSGYCTLGVFGSEVMRAYKAVGFPVNVAARLESAAAPGSILCGFRTYALVEDRVRAVRREPLSVRGAARPVEAWEIVELVGDDAAAERPSDARSPAA